MKALNLLETLLVVGVVGLVGYALFSAFKSITAGNPYGSLGQWGFNGLTDLVGGNQTDPSVLGAGPIAGGSGFPIGGGGGGAF